MYSQVHCYGCGELNPNGLKIKSYQIGGQMMCRWRPEPFHTGYPGYVYGDTIAAVVDCHAIWTAMAEVCRDAGHDIETGPPPFAYGTGKLSISYLKPVAIDGEMELRARVVDNHVLLGDEPAALRFFEEARDFLGVNLKASASKAKLNQRQSEILVWVAQGQTDKQIAPELPASPTTQPHEEGKPSPTRGAGKRS